MTEKRALRVVRILALAFGALAGAALVGLAVVRAQQPSDEPVAVAWDREACAHCHMHVGDAAFAGQIVTDDGRVLFFDDPGCLLAFEAQQKPLEHAVWFHHHAANRWLAKSEVAFVPVARSPMGYGLAAAEVGTAGSLAYATAQARAVKRAEGGEP